MEVINLTESESYENRRARAWELKQQLDKLSSFSFKLKFWLENIGSYPCPVTFQDGENAPFTLSLDPETDDDLRELHRVWMDFHRKKYALEKREVNKFGWRWSEAEKVKIAYHIQSLETLLSDLEIRLSTTTRRNDLLQKELTNVTAAIDAVSRKVNGAFSTLADEIKELRDTLETNREYDFVFVNEHFPGTKTARLAEVWDIVHYEKYLKDRLASWQINPESSVLPVNDKRSNPKRNEDTERKARQAVTLYEDQIESILQRERGKQFPLTEKEIVKMAIKKFIELATGRNLGATQRSLDRYLEDIGKVETSLKYGRQLVRQFKKGNILNDR
ncbi:hypothetical protein [Spirosoma panaciterrae]|uniref:hypothetical protein n=1 Tax=Spirosoma panaciterrae TaxID=496058 RepID=UPI00037A7F19|nr:hypothetical protein [Spirosoma panaciterrae]